jgi:hypothetical protein
MLTCTPRAYVLHVLRAYTGLLWVLCTKTYQRHRAAWYIRLTRTRACRISNPYPDPYPDPSPNPDPNPNPNPIPNPDPNLNLITLTLTLTLT